MGDDAKLRARRYRAHKRGDHSLCVAGRCEAFGGTVKSIPDVEAAVAAPSPPPVTPDDVTAAGDGERTAGRIESMARAFVGTLPYAAGDPRAMLGELAVELARRVDETGAAPAAIRELRVMLMQLAEAPNGPAGIVDEMRVRQHQQQLDAMLAASAGR